MSLLLTTVITTTIAELIDIDNNSVVFTHPVVDENLLANWASDEIRDATSLQTAITNGDVILTFNSEVVNDISFFGLGGLATPPPITWIDYAAGFSADPVLTQTIASGDVYTYTYSNGTLYRLVPSGSEQDAFYSTFTSSVLSDLVAQKGITI